MLLDCGSRQRPTALEVRNRHGCYGFVRVRVEFRISCMSVFVVLGAPVRFELTFPACDG